MSCPLISNFRFLKNSHFTAPFGNADLSEAPGSTTLCSINRCTTNSYNSIIDHEILTHHLVESQSRIGSHSNELRKHSPILLSLFLAISRILGFNKSSYRSHHSRRMKGCLGLIVTYFLLFSIHANATSEHVQMLSAMSFLDEHEFQTQCRNQKIDLNLFHFSASSIANSQEFWKSSHEIDDGSFLGNELSFPAALTDLPISFHVASMGHPTSNYNGIIFTHVPDQAGGKHSALQINSKPGNDDLRISFSNKVTSSASRLVPCLRNFASFFYLQLRCQDNLNFSIAVTLELYPYTDIPQKCSLSTSLRCWNKLAWKCSQF